MKTIQPIQLDRWYSLLQAVKLTKIRSREILTFHIRNGFLKAMQRGEGVGKRYLIQGADIIAYNEFYDKTKLNKYHKFVEFNNTPINTKYEKVSTKTPKS